MAPRQVSFTEIGSISDPQERKEKCLLYIWQSVPGITDSMIMIDEGHRQATISEFITWMNYDKSIFNAFQQGLKKHGYPWHKKTDDEGGIFWAVTLARAALSIKYKNSKKVIGVESQKLFENVRDDVRKDLDFEEWSRAMDRYWEKAQRLNKEESSERERMDKQGPQRFPGNEDAEPIGFI